MKAAWQAIAPWFDRQKYFATTYSVIVGCWFIVSALLKDKPETPDDLFLVKGTLSDYSFRSEPRGTRYYFLRLKEYPASFQIPADFIEYFEKTSFESKNLLYNPISIKIHNKSRNNIHSSNNVVVFEIATDTNTYLNSMDTLKKENGPFHYIAGLCFIVGGIGFFVYKRRQI